MLKIFGKERPSMFDEPMNRLLAEMRDAETDSEEYSKMVDQLDQLNTMKLEEKKHRVSPDTWVIVGGNLLGILSIVAYEHAHVVTTKALSFVLKTKHS